MHSFRPSPVLLVVDDLHQADETSALLLAELAPALAATGVLIVATWRASPNRRATAGYDVLEVLVPWSQRIAIGRLDEAGVRAVAKAAAGGSVDDWSTAVDALLAERSGGNPLLLRVILDELGVPRGVAPSVAGLSSLPVDGAVADALGRRLRSLPRSCRDLLEALTLIGGEADVELLGAVLGRDVHDDLARLEAADVVGARANGDVCFVHQLLSESVVSGASDGPAELHRRIAEALRRRSRPADLPAVAHHLDAARPLVSDDDVHVAAIHAATFALRRGDQAIAARNLDLALNVGSSDDTVELLLRSASAHQLAGHPDEGWDRARQAAELAGEARPTELARAAIVYARGRRYSTERDLPVSLLHRALDVLDADHHLRHEVLAWCSFLEMTSPVPVEMVDLDHLPGADDAATSETTVAWNWVHQADAARATAQEALDLARATGDQERVSRVSMAWRRAHCAPEFLDDRLVISDHAWRSARTPSDRAYAAIGSVLDHLEAGDRAVVDQAMDELSGLAAATGDPAVRWRTSQLAAMVALASGQPAAAERHSAEGFAHGAQAGENGRWVVRSVQATVLGLETADDPRETVEFLAANVEALSYPPMRAGVVYGLSLVDRTDEACRYLPQLVTHLVEDRGREASWLLTAALTADAIANVADDQLAAMLAPVLEPFADRIAVDGLGFACHGSIARPLSRLQRLAGRRDEARRLLEWAVERDRAVGLRRFELDGAVDLLDARRDEDGVDDAWLRAQAAALADEATAAGLTRTAQRARARQRAGVVQLTDRQHDVLAALASGLTYQAAGEKLGFSHSTIRHEAMRVYAVLGVGDRDAAMRVARGLGLIPD